MAEARTQRPDILVISKNQDLLTAFRRFPNALGRPVRVHQYSTLTHPSVLDAPTPWAVVCLDVDSLHRDTGEAWEPVVRRITQRYPRVKWVACLRNPKRSLPAGLYVHAILTPPWNPERLVQTLKPLLFPSAAIQAAVAPALSLVPRPEWLSDSVIRERLQEVYTRFPVKGVGWYDFRVGPLLWEGEMWPSNFHPHPPTPSDAHLERYAWWTHEGEELWFYALPVFQHTWLVAWGTAPFPHRTLQEHFAALRDAFQHLEPEREQPGETSEEEEFPPEKIKPLFDDVPPPFPNLPFGY